MSEIDDVFDFLIKDSEEYFEAVGKTYLHRATLDIAEAWANEIISMLISKNISPPLSEKTIKRRASRKSNVLGPDNPLLETGEWITYIEFRVRQHDEYDELEVGVFDEVSKIGHTASVTPAYIAKISEYGDRIHIPARAPFATSELRINAKVDSIIREAWDKIPRNIDILHISSVGENFVGRIASDGANFVFRWDQ